MVLHPMLFHILLPGKLFIDTKRSIISCILPKNKRAFPSPECGISQIFPCHWRGQAVSPATGYGKQSSRAGPSPFSFFFNLMDTTPFLLDISSFTSTDSFKMVCKIPKNSWWKFYQTEAISTFQGIEYHCYYFFITAEAYASRNNLSFAALAA